MKPLLLISYWRGFYDMIFFLTKPTYATDINIIKEIKGDVTNQP